MTDIENFLTANGFVKENRKSKYSIKFENDKCSVVISLLPMNEEYYIVKEKDADGGFYSPNLNIYWLIGVLTYYGYMDKNYKQLNK